MRISVIIPTLNEEAAVGEAVASARLGERVEVLVADGGSRDATVSEAQAVGARVLACPPGKARQMNFAAAGASGDALVFLHADTRLPHAYDTHVRSLLSRPGVAAGAFRFGTDAAGWTMRLVERVANVRSRILEMPYGDQVLFVTAERFHAVGGFPDLPIMEDYELVRRLRRVGRIVLAPAVAKTSARRWIRVGVWRVTAINQAVVLGYHLGIPLSRLARWYGRDKGVF